MYFLLTKIDFLYIFCPLTYTKVHVMKLIERVKDIFQSSYKMSDGFVHNSDFDSVVLRDWIKVDPLIRNGRDGHLYIYFEQLNADEKQLLRKMGFNIKLHRSLMYYPPKFVYRARISRDLKPCAKEVVHNLLNRNAVIANNYEKYKSQTEYAKYIENYKIKTK